MQPGDAVRAANRSLTEASLKVQIAAALQKSEHAEIAPILERLQQVLKLSHSKTRSRLLEEELKALQGLLLRERLRELGEIAAKADTASRIGQERATRVQEACAAGRRHLEVNAAGKHLQATYYDVDGSVLRSYQGPRTGQALATFLLECDNSVQLLKSVCQGVNCRAK